MTVFRCLLFSLLFIFIHAEDEKNVDPLSGKIIPDNFASTGNNTPHCPPGWELQSKINSCILMPSLYLSWDNAANYCENITGGDLTSILNQMEYDIVRNYGTQYAPAYPLWIGLYNRKDVSFNSYKWMDGRSFNYTRWLDNEPVDPKNNCYAFKTLDAENGYKSVGCKYQQPFICRQHSIACPSEIYNDTTGIVSSPNYPDNYDNQLDCFFHIIVPDGYVVNLTVLDFYTETLDYLNIYDGPNNNSFLIYTLKGYSVGAGISFESTQNELTLWFHTDYSITYRGWSFNYTAVTPNPANWYNASSGTITSPNYPNNYTNNLFIQYKIVTPENTYVQITVADFITETCCDYLKIINGISNNDNNTIVLLKGNYTDSVPMVYNAQSNMVMMIFYTDYSVVRSGFSLYFEGLPLSG